MAAGLELDDLYCPFQLKSFYENEMSEILEVEMGHTGNVSKNLSQWNMRIFTAFFFTWAASMAQMSMADLKEERRPY